MSNCTKIVFASRKEANTFIRTSKRRRGKKSMHKCRPYRCPKCEGFHLTSQTPKESKSRKRALRNNLKKKGNDMITINKVKDRDCCICAYAMCEGVSWKVSKRRLRKHLVNRKKLGVSSASVRDVGISGYSHVIEGSFQALNEIFNFGTGIIFINWGDGTGHAVFWDGCKFIDHIQNGRLHNKRSLEGLLSDGECVCMILKKDKQRLFTKLKSFISMYWFKD